jgi:hypothetical protein
MDISGEIYLKYVAFLFVRFCRVSSFRCSAYRAKSEFVVLLFDLFVSQSNVIVQVGARQNKHHSRYSVTMHNL